MNSDLVRLTKLSQEHDLNELEIIKKCIFLNIPVYLDFTKDLYPNGRGVFKGKIDAEQLTLECLRYMYRLLFLFYIEIILVVSSLLV